MKVAVAILGLLSISYTAWGASQDMFAGEYSQDVAVQSGGICIPLSSCIEETTNDIKITPMDQDNRYRVKITTVSATWATCELDETMTRSADNRSLEFMSQEDGCSVKVELADIELGKGVLVTTNDNCSNRCQAISRKEVGLDGTGLPFIKKDIR